MPWYGFIHPLLAIATLVFGIMIAQTSMSRTEYWDFPLRRQRTRSIVYFLLCVANLVMGFLFATALRGRGVDVKLSLHVPLAIAATATALLAAAITFTRSRRPGELPGVMRYHGWFVAVSLAIVLTMAFTGVLAVFGV
ncbi:MAG: hypothetical protein JSU73_06345 [candidate division WOR-3 bacterium]|nr:MAG: hypothetical protein JSU73_06345 [candidate division WOR-3 bacterium]